MKRHGSKEMYANSPKLGRGEGGKVEVTKKPTAAEESAEKENGQVEEMPVHDEAMGVPPHARHVMERMDLHAKHQHEHHTHDHGKHGDKHEMHERHMKEHRDMFKRHEKELASEDGGREDAMKKGEKE